MISTETLSTLCEKQIYELVLSGKLLPGERIKGEYLKLQLGVGLSPIREALSRMISTGLIELTDNVGFRVAKVNQKKVYDLYKSYAKLEALILRDAIENGDEVWESQIIAALYRLSKIEANGIKISYSTWSEYNENFHKALIDGCILNELHYVRQRFILIKNWYNNLANNNPLLELNNVNHSEHKKIAEYALARKADAACTMLYNHTMHGLDALVLKLRQRGY